MTVNQGAQFAVTQVTRNIAASGHGERIDVEPGGTTMFTSTKIAVAAALILGAASTALANDSGENHQDGDRPVVSGNAARVNPWVGKSANAGDTYGYAEAPIHKQRPVPQSSSLCNILYPIPCALFRPW
jgi:hypothetical protein